MAAKFDIQWTLQVAPRSCDASTDAGALQKLELTGQVDADLAQNIGMRVR